MLLPAAGHPRLLRRPGWQVRGSSSPISFVLIFCCRGLSLPFCRGRFSRAFYCSGSCGRVVPSSPFCCGGLSPLLRCGSCGRLVAVALASAPFVLPCCSNVPAPLPHLCRPRFLRVSCTRGVWRVVDVFLSVSALNSMTCAPALPSPHQRLLFRYSCIITNDYGGVESRIVNVMVKTAPKRVSAFGPASPRPEGGPGPSPTFDLSAPLAAPTTISSTTTPGPASSTTGAPASTTGKAAAPAPAAAAAPTATPSAKPAPAPTSSSASATPGRGRGAAAAQFDIDLEGPAPAPGPVVVPAVRPSPAATAAAMLTPPRAGPVAPAAQAAAAKGSSSPTSPVFGFVAFPAPSSRSTAVAGTTGAGAAAAATPAGMKAGAAPVAAGARGRDRRMLSLDSDED